MVTSWPTIQRCARKGARKHRSGGKNHYHGRARKGSKAQQAAKIAARDKRQLPERKEYAAKVFAWVDHERRVSIMERDMTGECKTPCVPVVDLNPTPTVRPRADGTPASVTLFRTPDAF